MNHEKKFAAQEQQVSEVASTQTTGREFGSVEELLRFDTKQTDVPAAVLQRLSRTLAKEPVASRPWWKKFF